MCGSVSKGHKEHLQQTTCNVLLHLGNNSSHWSTLISLQGPAMLNLYIAKHVRQSHSQKLCGAILCWLYKANAAEASRSPSNPTFNVMFLSAQKYTIKSGRPSLSLYATSKKTKYVNFQFSYLETWICMDSERLIWNAL